METVAVGSVRVGRGQPLAVIAGPCVAESEELCVEIGEAVRDRCVELGLSYVFKASFDKANRSSIHSQRGPGLGEGLELLGRVRDRLGVPVTTDIHLPEQAREAAGVVDLLQIPAFLCRQTDLLAAAGETGKPVNVKKGQFMSPGEMVQVVAKLRESQVGGVGGGGGRVILTERGTFFGYQRLVNDFIGLGDLMELGCPVCFDATHSTQLPGAGEGGRNSGGRPERAGLLARCAVAAGVAALFFETHPQPAKALSDASTMLPLREALALLEVVGRLHRVVLCGGEDFNCGGWGVSAGNNHLS